MSKITKVWAREILDSRGEPAVEVAALLETGEVESAGVPSGSSTGSYEALELRDNDPKRFNGKGVLKAVENVNKVLGPGITGMDPSMLPEIDKKLNTLDGTENKSKYGANAILGVSTVCAKLGARSQGKKLYEWIQILARARGLVASPLSIPIPLFNMINGGAHGAGNLDFQEFWVIPSTARTYKEALQIGAEIYKEVGENLKRRGAIHSVGDEGGYAPNLFTNADALEVFVDSIMQTNYSMGRDVFLGLDIAANHFYKDGVYTIKDKPKPLSEEAMIDFYKEINEKYKPAVLEDPFYEDSWDSWKKLTALFGKTTAIVGDDLIVTNPKRLAKTISEKAANSILVKPNQIGTITETLDVVKIAKENKFKIVVSNRSGETNDSFIADLAVGVSADYAKLGAPARGERVAKYNRLLTIFSELTNVL